MKTVSNLNELIANIQTLDGYLNAQVDPEYDFALNLIKHGTCFVAMEDSAFIDFIPVDSLVTLTIQCTLI